MTFLSSVGAGALSRPTLMAALIAVSMSVFVLVLLVVIGLCRKRLAFVVFAGVGGLYLFIADGGTFPGAERFLPTEWVLSRCASTGTVLDNGQKRSDSLSRWATQVILDERHKDHDEILALGSKRRTLRNPRSLEHEFDKKRNLSRETDFVQAGAVPPIVLPAFKFTPVTTIKLAASRDRPQNRPFFMIGHCCFFMMVAVPVLLARWRPIAAEHDDVTE